MPIHEGGAFPECATQSDVLIAGAGAVGIAMAVRLARAGLRVTVLEAGPADPEADFRKRNAGLSVGRSFTGLKEGRMKALGGTTNLWGGQLVPFDEHDLAAVDDGGRPLWPISHADYTEAVDKAYSLLGIGSEARDTDGLWQAAAGSDVRAGEGLRFHMNVWLPEPRFRVMFAQDLETLANLHIVTGAKLSGLEFAKDGRVLAYRASVEGLGDRLFQAREYVLASGTIEIVRTLLSSAAVAPNCPYAANPHIGRWFMDHLHGLGGTISNLDEARLGRLFDNVYFDGRKYNVKIRRDGGGEDGINVAATINSRISIGDLARDSLGLGRRMFSGHANVLHALRKGVGLGAVMIPLAWRYLVRRRSTSLLAKGAFLGIEVEQRPNAESYLFLDPAADPASAEAVIHWSVGGGEIGAAADIAERVRDWFAAQGLGKVELDPRLEARDAELLDDFHDVYHHMGGARMADCPDNGVVDSECRVFGTSNLTIGGAAVFPSGSFANPTLSAIALGLRSADRIVESLGGAGENGLVSRLVFGCGRLTGGASETASLTMLDHAYAAGVRTLDCAPTYGIGTAEIVVGKWLRRASRSGKTMHVIAKIGSDRPAHAVPKTYLRAAKRMLRPPRPISRQSFEPVEPCETFNRGDFSAAALRASFNLARKRIGRIDELLLHDCAPGDFASEQQAILIECAGEVSAKSGYAISSYFDLATHHRYPDGYAAECAVRPDMLTGEWKGGVPDGIILHSIVPTGEWLARTNPAFADGLERAARLLKQCDPDTARVSVFYALVAANVPKARIVFASSVESRLLALLGAFAEIERNVLLPEIRACFG